MIRQYAENIPEIIYFHLILLLIIVDFTQVISATQWRPKMYTTQAMNTDYAEREKN